MSELEPGKVVLGRYRIVHSLGAGGMGVVYLAETLSSGKKVVIKTVHDHLAHEPEMQARFLREAEATRALRHPNVVDVIEASADPLLLVLEHLPGQSLQEQLREGPLPEADVMAISIQLLDALDAAHRAKLIHRDLKPGNVMVLRGNRVKLLDFGISRIMDEARHTKLTQTGQILGTPGYLAPEQALAQPVDARTDVYALGVLMYRALTGRLPFDGRAASLLRAVVQDEPHPLPTLRPNVDPGLASVVHRALQKDPSFRFQSAREMRDALAGPRKSRWMLVAAIAGVATAAITVGTLAMLQSEPELALRPVAPIVSAPIADREAEAEAARAAAEEAARAAAEEAARAAEAEAEARATEARADDERRQPARGHRETMDLTPTQSDATRVAGQRGSFEVEFPRQYRAPMQQWWRMQTGMLSHCFVSVRSSEIRNWIVTFDEHGHVIALAVGEAPFMITACALRAVRHSLSPTLLHGAEVTFRVRWIPPG